ncbi:MAG: hypothetical protein GF331_23595 [Chitinivibrionales bacterium]|nr:hypothetical protein [Chitinivibrionales bacterium]
MRWSVIAGETLRPTGNDSPWPDVKPYAMTDELYRFSLERDSATLWLEGHSAEHGVHPVGWTRSHGKGTVYALTIAHEVSSLRDECTQGILQGILASARRA